MSPGEPLVMRQSLSDLRATWARHQGRDGNRWFQEDSLARGTFGEKKLQKKKSRLNLIDDWDGKCKSPALSIAGSLINRGCGIFPRRPGETHN
jgi:hypothetical protein